MLVLKVVRNDMTSFGGFKWPEQGPVSCPDWRATPSCGGGLHGWANGEGDYCHEFMDGKWLVVDVKEEDAVSLNNKIKFKCGDVVYCGDRAGAVALLIERRALTETSKPGWCCFDKEQLKTLATRSANRAVKTHAVNALRARGHTRLADKIAGLPDIVDAVSAKRASTECGYAAHVAYAARYAAHYAADATYAAHVAYAARYAAHYAADATYAAHAAYYAAYYAADARAQEREASYRDRREVLGLV